MSIRPRGDAMPSCRRCRTRRVEHDLVVLPQPLEEAQRPTLTCRVLPDVLDNLGDGAPPVYGPEQPILGRVDGENEVGKRVSPVDQDGYAAPGRPLADADGPRQADRHEVTPGL